VRALSTGVAALALTCLGLGAPTAFAGVADPDPSFGDGGLATVAFDTAAAADAIAIAPDGDIVVVGSAEDADGTDDFAIARLNPNGTLDENFSDDGRLTLDLADGGNDGATGVAVRSDGRIVVGGTSVDRFAVLQLLADGTPDGDFAADGTIEFGFGGADYGYARDLVLDPAGNAVVVGRGGSDGDGGQDAAVARITPAGELDDTFAGDGKLTLGLGWGSTDAASAVTVLPGGELVIAGHHFQVPNGNGLIARIDGTGSVQALKSLGSGRYFAAADLTTLADGRPLAVGDYQPHAAPGGSAMAWSLEPDGETPSWDFVPEPAEGPVRARAGAVAALSDGRAIVGGAIGDADELFLFDATTDEGFVATGEAPLSPDDIAVSSDSRVVAAGGSPQFSVARFLAPTVDPDKPPTTKIVSGPRGKVAGPRVKFRFRSRAKDASFECKIDGQRWRGCDSPAKLGPLDVGKHRFKVRAVSPQGTPDKTPAKRRFTID
jgi:uncharacterized delta-60 repeat protein